MKNILISVFVGSLRRDSFNRKLAGALARLAPADFTFEQIEIGDLPLYNQDDDGAELVSVMRMKNAVTQASGLLFLTAEYNRSMPGVLKNAIDHGSRPYGQSVWAGKPAAVGGVSLGATGTCMAQQHLRNTLAYLDVPTMGQPELFLQFKPELFSADGSIGAACLVFMQDWMSRFEAWVRKHQA